MNAGMNWTAWNSVRANALTNSPSAMPSSALPMASSATSQAPCGASSPSALKPTVQTTAAWIVASAPNASPQPASRSSLASGSVISRSSVPVVRSRSIVIDVEEHRDQREQPAQRRADLLERVRERVEHVAHEHEQD